MCRCSSTPGCNQGELVEFFTAAAQYNEAADVAACVARQGDATTRRHDAGRTAGRRSPARACLEGHAAAWRRQVQG